MVGDLNQARKAPVGYANFKQSFSFALLVVWIPDQKTSGMTSVGWSRNGGGEQLGFGIFVLSLIVARDQNRTGAPSAATALCTQLDSMDAH